MSNCDVPHGVYDRELDCSAIQERSSATKSTSKGFEFGGQASPTREERPALTPFRKASESIEFSLAAGIAAPLMCLVFDPLVFKGGDEHGPIFGHYWVFAYSLIALEILALTFWLRRRERLGVLSGVVAGTLLAGSVFAFGLGLALLPFSLLALLAVIGALGFTPFLTSFVFCSSGILALRSARSCLRTPCLAISVAVGVVLAYALPYSLQSGAERGWRNAVEVLADGDASAIRRVQLFYRFRPHDGNHFPIEAAIEKERDPVRKQRLVEANRTLRY
jgi:hypothetical protein